MKILDILTMAHLGQAQLSAQQIQSLQMFAAAPRSEAYLFSDGIVVAQARDENKDSSATLANYQCNLYYIDNVSGKIHLLASDIQEEPHRMGTEAPLLKCQRLTGIFISNPEYYRNGEKGIKSFIHAISEGNFSEKANTTNVYERP